MPRIVKVRRTAAGSSRSTSSRWSSVAVRTRSCPASERPVSCCGRCCVNAARTRRLGARSSSGPGTVSAWFGSVPALVTSARPRSPSRALSCACSAYST